jgi:hypothetical protein
VDGTSVRCGGVGGVGARSGGAAAGAGCRGGVRGGAGLGGGAVTVTEGTGVVPGAGGLVCDSGLLDGGCGAGVPGAGVCGAGVSGAVGGFSGGLVGAGAVSRVCEVPTPARHSSISAELPSNINRF